MSPVVQPSPRAWLSPSACVLAALLAVGVAAGPLQQTPKTQCIQAQAVFRHGARTPVGTYPTDPYSDPALYEPFGLGRLTTNGRYLEYTLGRVFRNRYVGASASSAHLLPESYSTGILAVKTSAIERTQESAAAALAGMWVADKKQEWGTEPSRLGDIWIPIPYYTIPADDDKALAGTKPCAARDVELDRVLTSLEYKKRLLRVLGGEDTLRYIEKNAGFVYDFSNSTEASRFYEVFSAIQCQVDLGMAAPDWVAPVYPEPLRSAANLYLLALSSTPQLRRQSFGDLTTWLLDNSRNHESRPKFHMFSAHDSTVSALIQIMNLEPLDDAGFGIPEFSACIMVELHQDASGVLGYRFFYRREPEGLVIPMVPKGCDEFCPLDKLETLVAPSLPIEGESCGVATPGLRLTNQHTLHLKGRPATVT